MVELAIEVVGIVVYDAPSLTSLLPAAVVFGSVVVSLLVKGDMVVDE